MVATTGGTFDLAASVDDLSAGAFEMPFDAFGLTAADFVVSDEDVADFREDDEGDGAGAMLADLETPLTGLGLLRAFSARARICW